MMNAATLAGLMIAVLATAEPAAAQTFVPPTGQGHFALPAGKGQLKVCRSPDNEHREAFVLPAGSEFVDVGKIGAYDSAKPGWWLLQVHTRKNVAFERGQNCATVAAMVVPTEVPHNYRTMKSLTRFKVADQRRLEILAPNGGTSPFESLAMIYLSATAITNFDGSDASR